MSDLKKCPNCNADFRYEPFNKNKLLHSSKTAIINKYRDVKSEVYCNECGLDLFKKYKKKLTTELEEITNKINKQVFAFPVVSTHSPLGWDYDILDMVTGQPTTGTGVFAEFASTFTDLFGMQSEQYNKKIKAGEDMCFAQLRKKTFDSGGNAVIATDIDYAELGSIKGMIMVCMTGTAIKLKNLDVLGEERSQQIKELPSCNSKMKHLRQLLWNLG